MKMLQEANKEILSHLFQMEVDCSYWLTAENNFHGKSLLCQETQQRFIIPLKTNLNTALVSDGARGRQ